MDGTDGRALRALLPLVLLSAVVVLVTLGLARGVWLPNLHNGLLALAFTAVGAYVLFQRPGHLTGALFLATGAVQGVIFLGRQVGHVPGASGGTWLGWLGVWPVALALGLVTLSVLFFPDGRLPSPRWTPIVAVVVVVVVTVVLATVSAVWPVEYASADLHSAHPIHDTTPHLVATAWSHVAHPAYAALQLLWVVAVVARWRRSDTLARSQLVWLAGAAVVSAVALAVGLAGWGTPAPGLLAAALLPVAAGWAVVHGEHLAAYSALTWLSRSGPAGQDLPHDLARAVAQSLRAPRATLWIGGPSELHAVGVWPETSEPIPTVDLARLNGSRKLWTRAVSRGGVDLGALTVDRTDPLSLAESRLLDDLAAQAALVLAHQNLAEVIASRQRAGHLEGLSPREQVVLDLMARGLSNAAICQELHLSIKTVEPVVGAIFTKLQLHVDADSNRRVLAVLAYLRTREPSAVRD